jgi:hypothetical protein
MGASRQRVEFYAQYREPYPPTFFKKVAEPIALREDETLLDIGREHSPFPATAM